MSSISIIGGGNMARTLGARALAGGHTVQVIGRDPAKATALADDLGDGATAGTLGAVPAGDIVILAVPYTSAVPVITGYGDALSGKIIIDITNPFNSSATGLLTPAGTSATEEIAKVAPPSAHVVKAFNTVFGHVLAADPGQDHRLDVFLAGNDTPAKTAVSAFIDSLGLRPLDTGNLSMAHWLEGAGLLIMGLARYGVKHYNFSLDIDARS